MPRAAQLVSRVACNLQVVALSIYAVTRELQLGSTLELTAPLLLRVQATHWEAPDPPPPPPPPPATSPLAVCYDVLQIELPSAQLRILERR